MSAGNYMEAQISLGMQPSKIKPKLPDTKKLQWETNIKEANKCQNHKIHSKTLKEHKTCNKK